MLVPPVLLLTMAGLALVPALTLALGEITAGPLVVLPNSTPHDNDLHPHLLRPARRSPSRGSPLPSGRTIAEAGLVIMLLTIAWSIGSWWQSRVAPHRRMGDLLRLGAVLVLGGTLAAATGLAHLQLVVPYLG